MKKRVLTILTFLSICTLLLSACGKQPFENSASQSEPTTVVSEANRSVNSVESEPSVSTETQKNEEKSDIIKKVVGASDENGIYSFIMTLNSDAIDDEGKIEFIFYGVKGSAQENKVVNTYVADFCKEDAGTYDVMTYYDGKIDLHLSHQKEVKINDSFGATVRGGSVVVSYTPKGGEKVEIYRADADKFKAAE